MSQYLLKSFYLSLLLVTVTGEAAEPHSEGSQKFIEIHEKISSGLVHVAREIDLYFGNKKTIEGRNGTNIRLSDTQLFSEGNKPKNELSFRLNFRLPNLQKRFQFSLEKRREQDTEAVPVPSTVLSTEGERSEEDLRAGLSLHQAFSKFQFKLTGGARLAVTPIPYANLRVGRDVPLGKWSFRFVSNFFGNTEEGLGESAVFDFNRVLTPKLLLRFANEETYLDEDRTLRVSNGVSLFQTLAENHRMSYSFRVNSNNRSTYHLESYFLGILYRMNIYKKFVFFDVSPSLTWPKSQNFSRRVAILFKLEVVFGEI